MTTALTVHSVDKQFSGVHAVRDISFEVNTGEIFALLGPNGAGKTTLVRMLMGIIRPDNGTITFHLDDPGEVPSPAELGYLPEDRGLYKDIPVRRTLVYFGMLRGMRKADATSSANEWLARMNLADRADDSLDSLSKGNQQKVQFISSILHRPRFAILDEPFSGLDPLNQDFFLDLLREIRDAGMTILLSAHQMALVERVADRIFLMNHGQRVKSGSMAELRTGSDLGTRMIFHVSSEPDLSALREHPAVLEVNTDGPRIVRMGVRAGVPLSELLQLAGRHLDIEEVQSQPPALHDIYIRALEGAGMRAPELAENGSEA